MTNTLDIQKRLEEEQAIQTGHFVLKSGRHSDTYVDKEKFDENALALHYVAIQVERVVYHHYKAIQQPFDTVIGLAYGAITLSGFVAHIHQGDQRNLRRITTRKNDQKAHSFRERDICHIYGKRCVIIEDIVTTGGSIKEVIRLVQGHGGEVGLVVAIVNRNPLENTSETMGVPFKAVLDMAIPSFTAEVCQLCQQGVPINTDLGHGQTFLDQQRQLA